MRSVLGLIFLFLNINGQIIDKRNDEFDDFIPLIQTPVKDDFDWKILQVGYIT